jgi:hypothetical protein
VTTGTPKCIVLWRGAVLGGIVYAVKSAENALFASYRYWVGQDYVVTNMEGIDGMVSFDGERGERVVGTFFSSDSLRSPYRRPETYDVDQFFRGMPPCHRCLLDTRRRPTVEWDEGIPCVTSAFWDDGQEYLTAADPWDAVFNEGAKLVRIELTEDVHAAILEWERQAGMSPEQVRLTRSLFDRRMAQEYGMIDLTKAEVAFLRSTSERSSDEGGNEERMTLCRHGLAAMGILTPL